MKKLITGIFGALVVIGLMAPTGGFPSRPTFQTVKVLNSVNIGTASTVGVTATVTGVGGGISNPAMIIQSNGSAGNSSGLQIIAGTNTTDATLRLTNSSNTVNFWLFNGDGSFTSSAQTPCGLGCLNAASVKVGGAVVPHMAAGSFTAGVSTCTATASIALVGISTCVGAGAGQTGAVTFSPAFTTAPVCTVQSTTPSTVTPSVDIEPTTTAATVRVTAGALGEFRLVCVGL